MKRLCFFIAALFVLSSCGTNLLTTKIKQEPYWCISSASQKGKNIAIKFMSGFSLYGNGKVSGAFPVNGFSGKLSVAANGDASFSDVSWNERGGPQPQMQEETALQAIMFQIDKVAFDGPKLVMSNKAKGIKIVYVPCDFAYMKNLKANTWKFVGFEKKQDTGVVAMHADPKEQYKNLTKLKKLAATFKCSGQAVYENGRLFYNISGHLGGNSYSAKLVIDKDSRKNSIQQMKVTEKGVDQDTAKEEKMFVELLSGLRNFSFAHNNLHITAKDGVEMIFSAAK